VEEIRRPISKKRNGKFQKTKKKLAPMAIVMFMVEA
jgi:hypothetical protein